ncbi:hypothetical protein PHET_10675 [Paragonimus heterotremus]|uniref:MD-2-related lipid-recognition domain-containing protein n=1 Tax=Paragonimus heterotremus TaxID=100268 RepID=A0A8J4WSI3_9TREM|nr:hypothetical protein PHET_10675 [Paragonimus heterotremus]
MFVDRPIYSGFHSNDQTSVGSYSFRTYFHNEDVCQHIIEGCPSIPGWTYTYRLPNVLADPAPDVKISWRLLDNKRRPFVCVDFRL